MADGAWDISKSGSARDRKVLAKLPIPLGPLTLGMFRVNHELYASHVRAGELVDACDLLRCDFFADFPEPLRYITPLDVFLFGSTGVDTNQFGWVLPEPPYREGLTTDELPVCLVRARDGEHVVMRDLATFLSLVATAGTEAISSDATEEDWVDARANALLVDGFREGSALFCTLSGVSVPSRPSELLADRPAVELRFERAPPSVITLDAARAHLEKGDREGATEIASLLVGRFIGLGELVPKANWQLLDALVRELDVPLNREQRDALRGFAGRESP
jgi:hypothetical protein